MISPWTKFFFWFYLLFLVWADGTAFNPADPDLWHRLTLGEYLVQHHAFPLGDTFSYLSDYREIADHEWGSALIFYGLYQLGGDGAMIGLKLTTLAVTLALVVWAGLRQRRVSVEAAAFYAVVLLALLPSFQSTVRCVNFTHIFFALWIYWFQCERHGGRVPTWAYAATMVLWANLHGGFAVGLAWLLVVAAIEGPTARRLLWLRRFGICLLVTLVNPFGWKLWASTARALVTPRAGFDEWGAVPWSSLDYPGFKMLVVLVVLSITFLLGRRGWSSRIDRPVVVLILGALAVAALSARQTSLFAIVAGGLFPGLLPPMPRAGSIADPPVRLGYIGVRSFAAIFPFYAALIVLPGEGLKLGRDPASCPVLAVNYLQREGIRGNLLVPFNYGSYAMWELRGRMRVSMDGRYDLVYRPETYRRVTDFFLARPNGQTLLTTPKPDAILLPVGANEFPQLQTNPAWREAYHNGDNAVFLPR